MDLGASRRGVDMGPSAVRYAKLHDALGRLGIGTIVDRGDLPVPIRESADANDASAKFLDVITDVCDDLALIVAEAVRAGGLPIVLGGDHSIAIGTLDGLTRARGAPPGLVWIDAHADINSPKSSPTRKRSWDAALLRFAQRVCPSRTDGPDWVTGRRPQ